MTEITDLEDLFYHELQVLWSAESMLVEKMPAMIDRARDEGLKNLRAMHLAETDLVGLLFAYPYVQPKKCLYKTPILRNNGPTAVFFSGA